MAVLGRGITGLPLSSGSLLVGVGGIVDELFVGTPGQVLTVVDNPDPSGTDYVQWATPSGSSGGAITGGENLVGSGVGVFYGVSGNKLQFKKIDSGSSNVTVSDTGNSVSISVAAPPVTSVNTLTGAVSLGIAQLNDFTGTPSSGQVLAWNGTAWSPLSINTSGEANTASNLGTGTGVFSAKSGVDLQFRSIKAGSGVSVALAGNDIVITNTDPGSAITPGLSSVGLTSPNSTLTVGNSPLIANGNLTVDLPTISGVSGVHPVPSSVTVDAYGRITAITNGTVVNTNKFLTFAAKDASTATASSDTSTFTFTGTDVTTSITGTTMNINLANVSGLSPGAYTVANITVDAKGRVTSASSGTLPNTFGSIVSDSGTLPAGSSGDSLTVNGANGVTTSIDTNKLKIALTNSGVTAGTYGGIAGTAAQVTVDAFGRVTAAQNKTVLQAVSGDLNPALGGNLNIGPYEIGTSSINGNIVIRPNGTGNVSVSAARITDLAAPIVSSDAATKGYVDSVAGTGGGGSPLEIDQDGNVIDTGVTKINFTGTGVAVSQTAAGEVQVDITGITGPTSELISETNVSSATNTVTISNIPANYDDLYMVIIGNVDGAASDIYMSVNGDTTTNYGTATWNKYGSDTVYGIYPARIASMEGSAIYGNLVSETTIDIPGYNLGTYGKKARAVQQYTDTTGSFTTIYEWNWDGAGAIDSITLEAASGNFTTGTIVRLYGRGGILSSGGGSGSVHYLNDLLDVSISNQINNQVLLYNGSGWTNTSLNLSTLTDVQITSPALNQQLVFDGSKWKNQSVANITDILTDSGDLTVTGTQISILGGLGIATSASGSAVTVTNTKTTLSSLDDVNFGTAPVVDQLLRFDGSEWVPYTLPDYASTAINEIVADDTNSILASSNNTSIAITGSNGIHTSISGNILSVDFGSTLSQIADVDITGLADGQTIVYDSTSSTWKNVPSSSSLAGLTDVNVVGVIDGYILRYNDSISQWEAVSSATIDQNLFASVETDSGTQTASTPTDTLVIKGAGGISTTISAGELLIENNITLDDITDVNASAPLPGQVLTWNGTTWSPAAASTVATLDDLTDVVINSPIVNQVIQYTGTNWANSTLNSIGTVTGNTGSIAVDSYNKSVGINGSTGITTSVSGNNLLIALNATLDDLSNVNVATPTVGDILYWDGTNWSAQAGGSFSLISDPNPTLGANLNTNGYQITSPTNQNISINPNGIGETIIGNVSYGKVKQETVLGTTASTIIETYDSSYEFMALDYNYTSSLGKRIGTLMVLTDGTDTSITDTGTEIGTPDVTFTVALNGPDVEVTMSTPDDSTIKFTTRKF